MQFLDLFPHFISTFIQSVAIKSGSYGGVSGQDSIWRGTMACMDHTLGMGFLAGLCNMIINPDNFLRLPVWDFLHTRDGMKIKEITLNLRHGITTTATKRKGRITTLAAGPAVVAEAGPSSASGNSQRIEEQFTPNLSQSFIPYILTATPPDKPVNVTKRSLHRTAARSVARLVICLASVMLVFIARVVLLSIFMPSGLARTCLYLAEVGRLLTVVMQELSILTYSCSYKGIGTWASPPAYRLGPLWNNAEQSEFDSDTVEFIGYALHAQAVFWAANKFWRWMGDPSEGSWKWRLKVANIIGASVSARFTSPSAEAFERVENFRLHVMEPKPLTNDTEWEDKYQVDFEVPSGAIEMLQSNLHAKKAYRLFAIVVLPFAICGYVGPAGFFTEEPTSTGQICFGVMQGMAFCLTYVDFMNRSINCEYVEDPVDVVVV
ncbi:hypothetical protein DFH06DRAFT_1235021 [Mycena polygramma]|nr:hypothetical protein DFH06DRAFT_1235021 [Mycena polygramma]